MSADQPPESISVPITWMGPEDVPILFVNAFFSQFDQTMDSFIVTLGQLTPPPLVGTIDQVREQAENITFVPVKPIARISLSEARMRELVATLSANLDQLERVAKMSPGDPR